jgi:hypothetical protein
MPAAILPKGQCENCSFHCSVLMWQVPGLLCFAVGLSTMIAKERQRQYSKVDQDLGPLVQRFNSLPPLARKKDITRIGNNNQLRETQLSGHSEGGLENGGKCFTLRKGSRKRTLSSGCL